MTDSVEAPLSIAMEEPRPPRRRHTGTRSSATRQHQHRKNNPSIDEVLVAELDELDDSVITNKIRRGKSKTGTTLASTWHAGGGIPEETTATDSNDKDNTIESANAAASPTDLEDHPESPTTGTSTGITRVQSVPDNFIITSPTTEEPHDDAPAPAALAVDSAPFPTGSMSLGRQFKPVAEANKKTVHRLRKDKSDRYFDYFETHKQVWSLQRVKEHLSHANSTTDLLSDDDIIEMEIPSLAECQAALHNKEATAHRQRHTRELPANVILDLLAALYVYCANSFRLETLLVLLNSTLATVFFCHNHQRFALKLDFSFLAFSVVFPLTFLIQSTFNRRELALQRLADFKSVVLSAALLTFTVDWDTKDSKVGGRLALPDDFAAGVATDFRDIIQLVYEYLSMPSVSHGRNIVFAKKRLATMRVHALQNDIAKRFNDAMFDLYARTNAMKEKGFPAGEASRMHQYHQYIQQRFELLRVLKYYRTPQATRSFGRVYIYVLPWLTGPYFAWVFEDTEENYFFTICLAAFTFLVLLGLLNTQGGLEDPFVVDYTSWTPGIDTVKLEFEFASVLQAIDQYYAQAELRRLWTVNAQRASAKKE